MSKVSDMLARIQQTTKLIRPAPSFSSAELKAALSKAGPNMLAAAAMQGSLRKQLENDMESYLTLGKSFDIALMEYDDTAPIQRSFRAILSVAQNSFDRTLDKVGNPEPDETPANLIHLMGLATQLWTGCRALEDHIHDWGVHSDLDLCMAALTDEYRNAERTLAIFGRDARRTRARDVALSLARRFEHDIDHVIRLERSLRDVVGVERNHPHSFWSTYEGFGGEQLHELMQAGFNAGLALEAVFEERAFATG